MSGGWVGGLGWGGSGRVEENERNAMKWRLDRPSPPAIDASSASWFMRLHFWPTKHRTPNTKHHCTTSCTPHTPINEREKCIKKTAAKFALGFPTAGGQLKHKNAFVCAHETNAMGVFRWASGWIGWLGGWVDWVTGAIVLNDDAWCRVRWSGVHSPESVHSAKIFR